MTELPGADGDEFTELVDADFGRVDLVGKGANGIPFLIAKSDAAGGLVPAEIVRGLIDKADPVVKERDDVTISGSPSAVMKMIHEAAQRASSNEKGDAMSDVEKATQGERADAAAAVVEGDNAPLPDADDLDAQAELDADGMGVPTADSEGDPDDPESPAWEAVDAARARQAIELAVALRRMVCLAQDREAQEAATGDDSDIENVFDLDAVLGALDCILGVLAPFAVTEQAEADERQADREQLMKGQVRKAGRVLSAQNEQAIRDASASLEKVLASLPAPITDDGAAVTKSEETTVTKSPEERHDDALALITKATVEGLRIEIEKGKGDPVVAVYDADGNLVGTIDPADLQPIAAPTPPDGGDAQSTNDTAADATDAASAPVDDAAAAPAAVAAPAPDEATIPGTDTVAAPAPTDDDQVQKATAAAAAAFGEILTPVLEQLGKHAELADVVKGLKERVEHLAAMPDDRKSPRMNGATGTSGIAQRDGDIEDPHVELRKAVENAADPESKKAAEKALFFAVTKSRFAGLK